MVIGPRLSYGLSNLKIYNGCNKAIAALKESEYQQNTFRARILKLQREKDEALKKYQETCKRARFIKIMKKLKNEKLEIKLKQIENK